MKPWTTSLLIALLMTFALAGSRIYDFATSFYPVAQPGECLLVHFAGKSTKIQVIANANGKSLVVTEHGRVTQVSFNELRDYSAEKVSCQ